MGSLKNRQLFSDGFTKIRRPLLNQHAYTECDTVVLEQRVQQGRHALGRLGQDSDVRRQS
jgi:hypothetical protein